MYPNCLYRENVYNHSMHDMTDNLLVSAAPSG
jgi:hypothetical protein